MSKQLENMLRGYVRERIERIASEDLPPPAMPMGYWDEENTLAETRKLVEELGEFPGQKKLREMRMTSLSAAISKHYGFSKMRELLGFKRLRVDDGFWIKEESVVMIAKECMEKYNSEHISYLSTTHLSIFSVSLQVFL